MSARETPRAEETPPYPCDNWTLGAHGPCGLCATCRNRAADGFAELDRTTALIDRMQRLGIAKMSFEKLTDKFEQQAAEITALRQQVKDLQEQIARGERVFEAVVYAYEGRDVPPDLESHGFVIRGRRHHASTQALREALERAKTFIGYARYEL